MLSSVKRDADGASVKTSHCYFDIYFSSVHIFSEYPHLGTEIQFVGNRTFGIILCLDTFDNFKPLESAYLTILFISTDTGTDEKKGWNVKAR